MAKKTTAPKLQEDIQTDEELNAFLDRPGLCVLDIYSEWCGPCLGMVGSLRKLKLDLGGDNLSFAICKADTIEVFKRFRRKSEPTWLFVTNHKAVNIFFGTDVPKLFSLIYSELRLVSLKTRNFYELNEYQPIELQRLKIKEEAINKALALEFEKKETKRLNYLYGVTNTIMENLIDMGVTIFGPQVNRDLLKIILQRGEQLKIQCKERKTVVLTREHFQTIHFDCPNPIRDEVLEQLEGKELFICYWKVMGDGEDVARILKQFAEDLQMSHTEPTADETEESVLLPAILQPLEVKIEEEIEDSQMSLAQSQDKLLTPPRSFKSQDLLGSLREYEEDSNEEEIYYPALDLDFPTDFRDFDEQLSDKDEVDLFPVVVKKKTKTKKISIPPIWTPNNQRSHAALIYTYFRNQTVTFLPPDPKPEPPYVIMAFDVYKKRDLILHAERYRNEVPMYGFFTSDDADEAKFITNSLEKYKVQTTNDKIVLKVKKATSHTMLQLVTYGPSYVSPNLVVAQDEVLKFFPPTYKTAEQQLQEERANLAKETIEKQAKSIKKQKTPKTKETIEMKRHSDKLLETQDPNTLVERALSLNGLEVANETIVPEEILDVYSDWCGPCLGMVGSLKKIKLEVGGDNLQLAICKADHITALKRFRRKSEPTWLFVTEGKAINLMFGTDVPRLMKLITLELTRLKEGIKSRPVYNIDEYQPEEVARRKVKEDAEALALQIETADREKKRLAYLTYVTDTIMENLSDIGITIFGPQVNRDMFKKINEPADALKIQCKDRKVVQISKADFDIIHFKCPNPLNDDVLNLLNGKELLVCFWKLPAEGEEIPILLKQYEHELTKTVTEPADEFNEEERITPAIIAPMDVKVEYEVEDDDICLEEESAEPVEDIAEPEGEIIEPADEEEAEEDELDIESGNEPSPPEIPILDLDLGLDEPKPEEEKPPEIVTVTEIPKKRTCTKTVTIPPIWVPNNHRTHAALIYVYFHNQTSAFLPPDPVPEPPHVIMAFDAYKKRDLISHAESHKDDVPLYGFFTSEDPDEAKFIANSAAKYKPVSANDKLILKVNKASSNTMLSLVTYGPSYVSPNSVVGHEEAKKFFPETYKTAEQEAAEEAAKELEDPSTKRKSKKSRSSKTTGDIEAPTTPTSGEEESGDSITAAAEGDAEGVETVTADAVDEGAKVENVGAAEAQDTNN
ncbi:hypothetical protein FF38_12290 [Lucilia cuprina]|uniref:DUF4746 domain-containing protein n=1 Tax=Lucilia cuprina TaxID=7375 RepID=A0A0L0CRZ1_LUCCU|nr:hypothetical protein FF38_12290 [Lucilia cuprina]